MKNFLRVLCCGLLLGTVVLGGSGCSLFDNTDGKEITGTIPPPIGGDPDSLNLEGDGKDGKWGKGAGDGSLSSKKEWLPLEQYKGLLAPVYFDFDKDSVKSSEQPKLDAAAKFMKEHPDLGMIIEGNCDDRGTEEYNRALGERRAIAVRNALQALGANDANMKTISYGKDRPAVQGTSEDARAKNRRGEFVPAKMQ